jgi:hypothetical protein
MFWLFCFANTFLTGGAKFSQISGTKKSVENLPVKAVEKHKVTFMFCYYDTPIRNIFIAEIHLTANFLDWGPGRQRRVASKLSAPHSANSRIRYPQNPNEPLRGLLLVLALFPCSEHFH